MNNNRITTNNNKIKRIQDGAFTRTNKNNSKRNINCVSIIPAKMLTDNRLDKVKEAESIEKDSIIPKMDRRLSK